MLLAKPHHKPVKTSELALARSICQESYFEFLQEFWDTAVAEDPVWNWHIEYMADEVQTICERIFRNEAKEYDECVNISPGTTKSLVWSVFLTPWAWTRMPHFKCIGASYSFPLAMDLSRKARDVVKSEKYRAMFPWVKIREDQDSKGYFTNESLGYRYAVGVNGSVTGMHGHLIVVDDPLDPKKAVSVAELLEANQWIKETLSSRKVDKRVSVMALIMQRLHQDDPTNHFLKKKRVRHVCLPAEDGPNVHPPELRKKYRKGLMDPVRLDWEALQEAMENGQYHYASQYLQSPTPLSGGMFKVDRIKVKQRHQVPGPNKWKRTVRYWDKAATADGGAYSVGVKMAEDTDGRFWILDVQRRQLDSYEREELIRDMAESDGFATMVGLEQEGGGGGKESAEHTATRTLRGYRVRIHKVGKADGSKVQRADAFSVQCNKGNLYLVEGDWNKEYVDELRFFPFSKFKDQVDASTGAYFMLTGRRVVVGGIDF